VDLKESDFSMYVMGTSPTRVDSLDGGSRIFIECARRWLSTGLEINFFTSEEGYELLHKYGLKSIRYVVAYSSKYQRIGLYGLYAVRMIKQCLNVIKIKPKHEVDVIYSGSDFWPDAIPAFFLKMRFKQAKWVAGFYLFAPNPFTSETPYKGKTVLKGLVYYLSQLPVYYLVRKYADSVWVTSEPDRWKFIGTRLSKGKVVAVRGGVDTKTPVTIPEPRNKKFEAVFIGRFHPQKGVLELIDIWKTVCAKKNNAKLAMIGVGELESAVINKIKRCGLEKNIVFFGFKDGIEKLRIFKDSRVVVHPAIYDSGGMAACEAMACGLPGVSFDLPALKTYYPKGMIKTPCYDLKAFAENILELLTDEKLYERTAKDALEWAKEWDWDKRAEDLLSLLGGIGDNLNVSLQV
jgi:glycosyltransferase involved in cell wall biosynthesis